MDLLDPGRAKEVLAPGLVAISGRSTLLIESYFSPWEVSREILDLL